MITGCSTTDVYPSHIQYAKAVLFNDQQTAENIELASTPKEAQELGNRVENFNQEQWNKEKDKITQHIVFLKFENNSTLRSILKGTGDVPIVEASPDREWGVGYYKKDVEAKRMWWGENLQGLCLMDSRALIIHIDAEEKDGQNNMEDGGQKDLSKNGQNGQKDDVQEDGGGGPKPLGQDSQKFLNDGGPKPLGQDNQNGRKDDVQKDGGGGPKPLQQDIQKGLKNGGKDDPTAIISANDPESGIASKDLVKVGDVFQLLNFDIWEWKFDLEELRSPNNETPPVGGSGEGFERALLSEVHTYSRAIPLAVKAQFPANPVGSMTPDEVLKGLKKAKRLDPGFNWKRIAGEFLFWNGREDESKKEKYRPGPVHLHLVIVSKVGDTYEAIRASPQPGRAGHNVFLYSEKVVTEYAPTGEHRVCAMEPVRGV
jgi:ribA/ribD-fused uncharacterized protein